MFDFDRRIIVIGVAVCLLAFFAGVKYNEYQQQSKKAEDNIAEIMQSETQAKTEDEPAFIEVFVCGEVKSPGVYRIKKGSRVYQAIEKAGGATADGNINNLHLARVLQDEETVMVTSGSEFQQVEATVPGSFSRKLNINTASADEMDDKLNGIGPALAKRIVDYRTEHGPFVQIEELKNVSGIGDKKFESIKNDICVK